MARLSAAGPAWLSGPSSAFATSTAQFFLGEWRQSPSALETEPFGERHPVRSLPSQQSSQTSPAELCLSGIKQWVVSIAHLPAGTTRQSESPSAVAIRAGVGSDAIQR